MWAERRVAGIRHESKPYAECFYLLDAANKRVVLVSPLPTFSSSSLPSPRFLSLFLLISPLLLLYYCFLESMRGQAQHHLLNFSLVFLWPPLGPCEPEPAHLCGPFRDGDVKPRLP